MSKIKIAIISDLHFGISVTQREKDELNLFLDFIKTHDVDLIHFNGDYFDHKLSLDEPYALLGMEFFNDVLKIAKEKNIKIRMIEGTQSHDRFQPRIFNNFIVDENGNNTIDFKFYETIGEECLLGLNILYVPEEYPINIDEYYAPYKTKQYDLMLVHGTWDFINFGGMINNNSRNDINTAPVFKYNEWSYSLEHGLAICGHIHGRHIFKVKAGDKIVYPGSFTAWSFDQISDRGFMYLTYDTETKEYLYELINNPKSPKYANLDVADLDINLETSSIEEIKNKIQEQKNKVDFIKVNIDALSLDKKLILKQFYKDNKEIRVEVTPEKILLNKNSDGTNKYEKYDYLLSDKLSTEKAIQKFIKEDLNKDISEEKIKIIITEDDTIS